MIQKQGWFLSKCISYKLYIVNLSSDLPPGVEGPVLGAVLDVAAVVGEATLLTQLLELFALILGEAPFFRDIDLKLKNKLN